MTYLKLIIGAFSLFISLVNFAQEESLKKILISEVQLFTGMHMYSVSTLSLTEMMVFAPNSTILTKDYSGFNNFNNNYLYSNHSYSVMLGINFKNKSNPLLRVGVNYLSKTNFRGNASREDSFAYDTLTSSQTGQQYYLDSTISNHLYMSQEMEQVSLDLSLLFRTDQAARWTLQGGIGLMLGYSFNAITTVGYTTWSSQASYTNQMNYSFFNREDEQFRNGNFFSTSIYLPIGVDFRIGKNREFWNLIHLFYEARPTVNIVKIPEWNTLTQFSLTQGIGVKIKW